MGQGGGVLVRKPLNLEKRPLVFMNELILLIDKMSLSTNIIFLIQGIRMALALV